MNQASIVQQAQQTLGNLRLTQSNNAGAYAAAMKAGKPEEAAKILKVSEDVGELYNQVDRWVKETTGNPQVPMVNVANALASAEKAKERLS